MIRRRAGDYKVGVALAPPRRRTPWQNACGCRRLDTTLFKGAVLKAVDENFLNGDTRSLNMLVATGRAALP